jgi:hypothetical protein
MKPSPTHPLQAFVRYLDQIYAADEVLDADAFVALLTEDVQFRSGSKALST